ncbi:MAG TPA: fumarylacetoacetate hydrolase family protein [Stellaceae bacterium]|nr:fumarylacetoacetate hydrolase family protein [Stellaceae bacterium]
MVDRGRVERIADYFDALARTRGNLPPLPPEIAPADFDEAYAAQEIAQTRWAATRGPIVGYKIAITTKVMQELMGIDQPCAGAIFSRTLHASPATVRMADFVHVAVECEIGMRLGADILDRGRPHDRESVGAAVESCHAAMEIIEDHNAEYKKVKAQGLVANNAWNGGAVFGPGVTDWRRLDLGALAGIMTIEGVEQGRGKGADVLGHPLNAVAWLANNRISRGRPLRKGMSILTGSVVATKFPQQGQTVRCIIEGLGEAVARFV